MRPGTLYRDLGNTISRVARRAGERRRCCVAVVPFLLRFTAPLCLGAGLSVVKSYCGHGVHRLFHTSPNVPHYARSKAVGVMRPGHIFTIEPMIKCVVCVVVVCVCVCLTLGACRQPPPPSQRRKPLRRDLARPMDSCGPCCCLSVRAWVGCDALDACVRAVFRLETASAPRSSSTRC